MGRNTCATILLSFLLALAITDARFFFYVKANPYNPTWIGERPAPAGALPPMISILNPKNDSTTIAETILLSVNLTLSPVANRTFSRENPFSVPVRWQEMYYKGDWQENMTNIDFAHSPQLSPFTVRIRLTSIPEGQHSITFFASERGEVVAEIQEAYALPAKYWTFAINSSSTVSFSVKPPRILAPTDKDRFNVSDIPLTFSVESTYSDITYCIDMRENFSIAGNTTLSGLPNGMHQVTVYVTDEDGNVGISETVSFSMEEPSPTILVIAVSGVFVAVGTVVVLVYWKKRK